MSQTVQTPFGTGTVVDRESVRGRVSYKVEGPGFSTWIEAAAMPLDFQWMPGPDEVQDNSVTLPYNPAPQTWRNPSDQNIVPGRQEVDPERRTHPADSVDFQEEAEEYVPGPAPHLFAGSLSPEDIQAKLGPKYVNAFVEHDFTSLQARIDENPDLVLSEYKERVAELVMAADSEYLERVGRNEYLEASDPAIREAAWKDVRAKAVRLRRSGQVNLQAANPDIIATQVTGDHGTYECLVVRSNIFQGNSAVDSWSCNCPWGQWAFKREHKFVGRLCSHAYASLLELQALMKSKAVNPRFRNTPGIMAERTASSLDHYWEFVEWAEENGYDEFDRDSLSIFIQDNLLRGEAARGLIREWEESMRMASRTAADTNLDDLQVLRFLYQFEDEGLDVSASGDEQWEWVKSNVDYDTLQDAIDSAHEYGELSASQADALAYDLQQNFFGSRTAEIVDLRPVGWDPYSRNLMNRLRDLWEEGERPGRQKERNEEIRELVDELRERGFATDGVIASLKNGFLNSPMGYDYIPDYGTSAEYVLEHEMDKREDVTEPEFEYTPGTDDGVVNDINDGGRNRTADFEDDGIYGEPMDYSGGDQYGGDEDPYYVDPAEREDWDDPLPDNASEDDIVANFQKNAGYMSSNWHSVNVGEWEIHWDYKDATYPNENPQAEIIVFVDFECEVRIWDSLGHLTEDYVVNIEDSGDPRGEQVRSEVDLKIQQMYEKDSVQAPGQMELWSSRTEDDIVANFQKNAAWLMGGNDGGSGGNDDIAAAAEAHLRTAGRSFTLAEQQALIDEDDGQIYDPSQLRLDGTHYL